MDEHGPDVPEHRFTDRSGVERVFPRFDIPAYDRTQRPDIEHPRKPDVILQIDIDVPERKYLPTFAELVDRMTIVQLKAVFIPEHAAEYRAEIALIEHDLDLLLGERLEAGRPLRGADIRAIAVLMLTNRFIWENESKARAGGSSQDQLLKMTHSVNGVRSTAKNILSTAAGERLDYKVDALAADMPAEFGNWNIWGG